MSLATPALAPRAVTSWGYELPIVNAGTSANRRAQGGRQPGSLSGAAYDWERFRDLLDLAADALQVLDAAMAQL